MLNFSYTVSPALKQEIGRINETRNKILLQLIPRKEELQMRFETALDRATQVSRLTTVKLKRQEILDAVDPTRKKSRKISEYASYPLALELVNQNWFLEEKRVRADTIRKFAYIISYKRDLDDKQIGDTLDFIQVNPEHPIVQSGLVYFLLSQVLPRDDNSIKLSMIASYIFMYKHGYDFRGLLCLEEFLTADIDHFKALISEAIQSRNLSNYLEYFAQAVSISAEHSLRKISEHQLKHDIPAVFYELSERQKEIMALFARPGIKVSNRIVQKEFKISQITASRDLSKLHSLGLIFSAGKGRSVYYTRI
jgi:hypothetical protein